MKRAKGTYTVMPNWALEAIEELALASDIKILNFLTRHRAFASNSYSTKQLAIALEIDIRTVQAGVLRLANLGYIQMEDGRHFVVNEAAKGTQKTHKASARPTQGKCNPDASPQQDESNPLASPVQIYSHEQEENTDSDADFSPLKEGIKEEKEEKKKDIAATSAAGLSEPLPEPVLEPVEPVEVKLPSKARKPKAPKEPAGHQLMFAAISSALYGDQKLTGAIAGRIGKVAKSLLSADFSPADVPQILAFIEKNHAWMTSKTAETIEKYAPEWRASQMQRPTHVIPLKTEDYSIEKMFAAARGEL